MNGRTLLAALVAVASLAVPVTSARACHFLDRCFGCFSRPTTTFYAPAACPQPACCPQQQVVNYMPQTCYRTVYVRRPVVAYRPTTCCDPCGRATTVMRPVTTCVTQAQLVPYTTYRPVVSTVAQPCCPTAAPTATYYAPAATPAPCCSPVSARTVMPAPAIAAPAPMASPLAPTTTPQETTPQPSLDSPPSSSEEKKTFESPLDENQPQSRMLVPPSTSNLSKRPYGLTPGERDRTTAIPLPGATVRQASLVVPARPQVPPGDNDGWRPAGR